MILITRIFDAPREHVFAAWTEPEQISAWYGPEHFDAPLEHVNVDLRVGGRWELTMVQRDGGATFPVSYEILELDPPALLVLRSDAIVTRVELHDHGEKTRMTLSDGPYPEPMGDRAEAGWQSAFDKLATLVYSPS